MLCNVDSQSTNLNGITNNRQKITVVNQIIIRCSYCTLFTPNEMLGTERTLQLVSGYHQRDASWQS